ANDALEPETPELDVTEAFARVGRHFHGQCGLEECRVPRAYHLEQGSPRDRASTATPRSRFTRLWKVAPVPHREPADSLADTGSNQPISFRGAWTIRFSVPSRRCMPHPRMRGRRGWSVRIGRPPRLGNLGRDRVSGCGRDLAATQKIDGYDRREHDDRDRLRRVDLRSWGGKRGSS